MIEIILVTIILATGLYEWHEYQCEKSLHRFDRCMEVSDDKQFCERGVTDDGCSLE